MKELNIGGVFLAPIVGYLVITSILYFLITRRHRRDLEHRVWHPTLYRFSIFILILTLIVLLF